MSFIGRQLAEGAFSGLLGKIDEFLAFLSNEPLPEGVRANYERITRSALTALTQLIGSTKRQVTSVHFARNVEKMTTRAFEGVTNATKKFFFGQTQVRIPRNPRHGRRPVPRQSSPSPLSSFMKKAETIIKDIGLCASKEAKKQLLSFFSSWIVDGIDVAFDSFKSGDAEYIKLKRKVDKAKQKMLKACQDGNFQGILEGLKETSKAIEDAPIYFNGIPLLRTSLIEDSAILKGINNAKALKDLAEKVDESNDSKPISITHQLDVLCKNLAIQNTYSFIFKILLDQDIPSFESIYETPRIHLAIQMLRKDIEASKATTTRKFFAHCFLYVAIHFFYHVLKHASYQLEKKIVKFINTPTGITLNFSKIASLFSRMNAAHLAANDIRNVSGTVDELVARNMESQEKEGSIKLYEKVQLKFLNEFSLKLPLTEIFWKKTWQARPKSELLNFLLFPVKLALGVMSYAILFIPELIINTLLSQSLKISFFWQNTLPKFIIRSLTSFSDYTKSVHPINLVMVDNLQKIWNGMKTNYLDASQEQASKETLCPVTKQSLDLALRHLFELLEKTPFETPQELMHYLQGQSPLEKTKISATRFFLKQNLSAFTTMIADAIKVSLSRDSKERLISQALLSFNQGFAKKLTLTQKQLTDTEEKVNILLSQILSLTVRKTIERRYNFTPKNQAQITDRFLRSLQNETSKLAEELGRLIHDLQTTSSTKPLALKLKIFCDYIQNKQLEIRSNSELPKNPRALINQWYCEPIQEHIQNITKTLKNLRFLEQINKEADYLKKYLRELKKPALIQADRIEELIHSAHLVYRSSSQIHNLIPHLRFIYEQFMVFQNIHNSKQALVQLLQEKDAGTYHQRIEELLSQCHETSPIHASLVLFKHTSKEDSLQVLRRKIEDLIKDFQTKLDLVTFKISQKSVDILDTTSDLDFKSLFTKEAKDELFAAEKQNLHEQIEQLDQLVKGFKPIEHFNIKLISTDDALELMQNFAYGCMIGPMEQLLKLIKKPYVWQYGLVNEICREFLE